MMPNRPCAIPGNALNGGRAAHGLALLLAVLAAAGAWGADQRAADEHGVLGVDEAKAKVTHTTHPGAQWFPEARFGLFIHFGLSTVTPYHDLSWPMIPGDALREKRIADPAERERIVREKAYNAAHPLVTPNTYWKQAEEFHPDPALYRPEAWVAAAKAAGCIYAVLTTQHHEGYSLWPSQADDFNTRTYLGGRDLVRPFVEACRAQGLKVGLYYSPPNWHFDREFMNFLYYKVARMNPELPELDADLNPRTRVPTAAEKAAHQRAYAAVVRGQVEELLTRYGTIDLLWFDGRVEDDQGQVAITAERIRELQPGIVLNPRLHKKGDFKTYENKLPLTSPSAEWGEFCESWTDSWGYNGVSRYRDSAYVIGNLARSRSLGVNYLINVGPDRNGVLPPAAIAGLAEVQAWMVRHGEAVTAAGPLPAGEKSGGIATARDGVRYLVLLPRYGATTWKGPFASDRQAPAVATLTLEGIAPVRSATLLADGAPVPFVQEGGRLTVTLAAERQHALVEVVKVEIAGR